MSKIKNILPNPLAKTMLWLIANGHNNLSFAIESASDLIYMMNHPGRKAVRQYELHQWMKEKKYKKHQINTTLKQLEKVGKISSKNINGELHFALTNKGWAEMLLANIKKASKLPAGYYTIIIFDIPEEDRTSRHTLRRLLRECNFTMLQRSVWLSKYNVVEEMKNFITTRKLTGYINVFLAKGLINK